MTHFRVRPKPISMDAMRLLFRRHVVELGDGSVAIPTWLGRLEEREVFPIVSSLADKARRCVRYDRRCAEIAWRR